MPKIGHFAGYSPKKGFLGPFRALGAGVLHQPLRRGPPRGLGGPGQGPGPARDGLRDPGVPGTQDPRIRDPPPGGWGRPETPSRGPGGSRTRPGGPARGVLHQPLAPGPRGTPPGSGARSSPGGLRDLPGGPKYHPRPWRAPDPLSGNRGAGPLTAKPSRRPAPGEPSWGRWRRAHGLSPRAPRDRQLKGITVRLWGNGRLPAWLREPYNTATIHI